jgi:hypothetical protein
VNFVVTALSARLNWICRSRRKLDLIKDVPTLTEVQIELPPAVGAAQS